MLIENIIMSDSNVAQTKNSPVVNIVVLLLAAVVGYLSTLFQGSENVSFAIVFIAIVTALIALKGIFAPKQYYQYTPTKEKIEKREYYFDLQDLGSVKGCIKDTDSKNLVSKLDSLPKDKGTSLRVVLYSTKSGSYTKYQMQKYIPYEYVPVN